MLRIGLIMTAREHPMGICLRLSPRQEQKWVEVLGALFCLLEAWASDGAIDD
jgi:hypothetical protein